MHSSHSVVQLESNTWKHCEESNNKQVNEDYTQIKHCSFTEQDSNPQHYTLMVIVLPIELPM